MANLSTIVTAAGNLTKDPEVRNTNSGSTVCKVTVAANPRTFNKDKNEWEDGEAVYWEGLAFAKFADNIAASFRKGDRVIIVGTAKTESWTDKESGLRRTKTTVMLDDIGLSPFWGAINRGGNAQAAAGAAGGEWGTDSSFDATPW